MSVIEEIRDIILLDKENQENRYWRLIIDGKDLIILPIENMKFKDMVIMGYSNIHVPPDNFHKFTNPYFINLERKYPINISSFFNPNSIKKIGYKITIDRDRLREWNLQNLLGSN